MEALYAGEEFADADDPGSVSNILARYADLEEQFPEESAGAALPYFVGWLIENVHLIEITAYSESDAYTIFERMNDRGLSPADMLKGYLLANITDGARHTRASRACKEQVQALAEIGKDEDADRIKSWLRSRYAERIRARKRGSPGFRRFSEESGLAFLAHVHPKKPALYARQDLYRLLAERLWSPERLTQGVAP
jgi:hypothetical protein